MILNKLTKFILFFGLVTGMASCSKSLNNDDISYTPDLTGAAAVGIVNASAGSPALDIALDNNRLGLSYFNYTDRVNYFKAYIGKRNFKIFYANSINAAFFTRDLSLEEKKYYTIFIVDTAAKTDAVLIQDSTRAAGKDSVRLRFANMSPDASVIDLYEKGNPEPIATGINVKTAGNFFSYPANANVIFEIRPTGQSKLMATSDPINLYNGYVYTIWCGGYTNGNVASDTRIKLSSFSH